VHHLTVHFYLMREARRKFILLCDILSRFLPYSPYGLRLEYQVRSNQRRLSEHDSSGEEEYYSVHWKGMSCCQDPRDKPEWRLLLYPCRSYFLLLILTNQLEKSSYGCCPFFGFARGVSVLGWE